jgi:hypothetical protein
MDTDTAMKSALSSLRHTNLGYRNISKTALQYGVDRQRLRRRLKGTSAKRCYSVNRSLNAAQKQELVDWILRYSDRGFPLRPAIIADKASELRRTIYPDAPNFHQSWVSRFEKQFSDQIRCRISSCIDIERTTSVSAASVRLYFEKVSNCP